MVPLTIKAMGRGSKQMCLMDKYGFPRTKAKTSKRTHGFKTGDIASANVLKGRKKGRDMGYVSVRTSGYFKIDSIEGINWKYCKLLQYSDGYQYNLMSNSSHD